MIQAVLFDLFETLVTESTAPVRRASSLARELGLKEDRYREQWRSLRPEVVLGRHSFSDALARIVRTSGIVPDERMLEQLRSERIREKAAILHHIDSNVLAVLKILHQRGVKLAVVSNCFAEDVAGWGNSPLRAFFSATVFSCAVGHAKPEPEIYLVACRMLRVPPSHALFIGDGSDGELRGARAAGLSACRVAFPLLPIGGLQKES
jgi:HAD superfamily hydrolase (TIGR01509 family)